MAMTVRIRAAAPSDAEACGAIMFGAFADVAERHGFPPDFPSAEAAIGLARSLIANPAVCGVVAEVHGRVVGSNFLSEADPIRGVGPITVEPRAQGRGVGRALMHAVIERANGAAGIRLLQDGFNMGSLALYAALGFEVREPVVVMSGRPAEPPAAGAATRPMTERDLDACDALCQRVHGVSRRNELADAVRFLAPMVAERDGRIAGYMTAPTFWIASHGVAETAADMTALLLGAARVDAEPLSFLLPTRQTELFGWCLRQGLRAVKPMTLMTIGAYRAPAGCYLPSVFY